MSQVPPQFEAWAVVQKGKPFEPFTYTPRPLGVDDVDVKIECCGICASDVHQVDSGWFPSTYPIVPGHEIVGVVVSKGSNVKKFNIGDRVGIGPQILCCFNKQNDCEPCGTNQVHYCSRRVWTYNSRYPDGATTYGGYAKYVRGDSHFVVKIPDSLPSQATAPLLCAGITCYDPLITHNVRNKKVAILGVGGLGHLGLKFAVALGNEVVGISRQENKRDEVIALGASDYIASANREQLRSYFGYFDFVLSTINDPEAPWGDYLSLVKTGGTFHIVGIPNGLFQLPVGQVFDWDKKITGSVIGSPDRIQEMLNLCAERRILSDVQVYPISQVNKAYEDFRAGKPRYRFVLQIE